MEGINLSSSIPEKNLRTSRFFNGTTFIIFIFFVLLSAWGGMYFYNQSLAKVLLDKQNLFAASSQDIKNDKANRIAEIDARMKFAQDQIENFINTDNALNQLESSVIPNIRLTKYEFDKTKGMLTIEGETDDFRYVPQQIDSFKTKGLAKDVSVKKLDKKEGLVSFTFEINF